MSAAVSGEEQINSVIEITGASKEEAQHLLAACGNSVETAVSVFFEQGVEGLLNNAETTASALNNIVNVDEEVVRAPIAPRREQLVGPEDDNFITVPTGRLARLPQRVKVCPLRDFAREGALMEEQLQAAAAVAAGNSVPDALLPSGQPRRRIARAAAMVAAATTSTASKSSSRLGDLFRPPTDIAYVGTFASARARSTELKHWLLVNVQNDNFDSQLLNRDVWADKAVRKVLRRQFLLWQVDSESSEGRRFVTFYHCSKLPYVCIIDPRTGEEMWKSEQTKQSTLLVDLQKFIREHRDFVDDEAPSTSKRHAESIAVDDDDDDDDVKITGTSYLTTPSSTSGQNQSKKRSKLMDLTEEEQIALAIKNSMKENGLNGNKKKNMTSDDEDGNDSEADSLEDFADDDVAAATSRQASQKQNSYEEYLGDCKDELTMLKLRLLNIEGADEVMQLRWPSDTRLQVLRLYINQNHIHIQKKGYKLICAFPRKALECEHDLSTLKELGLHPSANIHVTLED